MSLKTLKKKLDKNLAERKQLKKELDGLIGEDPKKKEVVEDAEN